MLSSRRTGRHCQLGAGGALLPLEVGLPSCLSRRTSPLPIRRMPSCGAGGGEPTAVDVGRRGRDSAPAVDGRKALWFLTQMCARFSPQQVSHAVERGCECARARESAVKSSIAQSTAACAGPALGGGLLDGSRSHRKVLKRWHLQGNEPGTLVERGLDFADVLPLGRTLADCSAPWTWQAPRDFRRVQWAGLSESLQFLSRYRRCSPAT